MPVMVIVVPRDYLDRGRLSPVWSEGHYAAGSLLTRVALCAGMFRHETSSACIVANIIRWVHITMVVRTLRETTTFM